MKIYQGYRDPAEPNTIGDCSVAVNGVELDPGPSQKIRNHSPDGFNWGYEGSGPAQLALAILLDMNGREFAEAHYQQFKSDIIARLPQESGWTLTGAEITEWALKRILDNHSSIL